MIKKLIAIMLTVIMIGSFAVYAQEINTTIDEVVDEKEVVVLKSPYGAEVRLAQLEKRVEVQIENAKLIIENIESNESLNANLTKLNEIVAKFEALLIDIENTDMNKSSELLTEDYVGLKALAIELTKEFRSVVNEKIPSNELDGIKEKVQERKNLRLNETDNKVEELKKKYNTEKFEEIFKRLGIEDNETVEKLRNGEMNIGEVRSQLVSKFKEMDREERIAALDNLREERAKNRVQAREMIENSLGEKVEQIIKEHRENIMTRINNTQQTSETEPGQRSQN